MVRYARVCQGWQRAVFLSERAEVQDEVCDAGVQRQSKPRRRRDVADRVCAEGTDGHRRGPDCRPRQESLTRNRRSSMAHIEVTPTLAAMADVYRLPREGGAASPRFKRYLELIPATRAL